MFRPLLKTNKNSSFLSERRRHDLIIFYSRAFGNNFKQVPFSEQFYFDNWVNYAVKTTTEKKTVGNIADDRNEALDCIDWFESSDLCGEDAGDF